jgi:two-component system response regulator HydG
MTLVLLVEDDPVSLAALADLVRAEGFETVLAENLADARTLLGERQPDAVLADYNLPDGEGIDLAAACLERGIDFILVTGEATLETAIEALRAGASDFLTKPVDVARLKILLASIARSGSYRREISDLRTALRELGRFGSMVGSSNAMQAVYDRISRVAPTDATVLVTGESGTGKELVAETLHRLSRRSHRPYVAINCGAIAANLIESELFGHERGAFTGADRQRKGVFERAHQGTLFLDEVSEMPIELQVKLLRVLESGEFTRVGGEKAQTADVRIVAASNRDLEGSVAEGRFRADLLYRLRVVPIELPPLRDRDADVASLAQHFLAEFSVAEGRQKRFSPRALSVLTAHSFPGNVRELRNAVQQAFILAEDEIGLEHLPAGIAEQRGALAGSLAAAAGGTAGAANNGALSVDVPVALADVERKVILATLERLDGDKPHTAEALGISLKTLYSRLREYSARAEA